MQIDDAILHHGGAVVGILVSAETIQPESFRVLDLAQGHVMGVQKRQGSKAGREEEYISGCG